MPTTLTPRTKPQGNSELWSPDYLPWEDDAYPWQNEDATEGTDLTSRTKPSEPALTSRTKP